MGDRQDYLRRLIAQLNVVVPEHRTALGDLLTARARGILAPCPTVSHLAQASPHAIRRAAQAAGTRGFSLDEATAVRAAARHPLYSSKAAEARAHVVRTLVNQLERLTAAIDDIDRAATALLPPSLPGTGPSDAELLQTIPGIGPQTAATLGERGTLARFIALSALRRLTAARRVGPTSDLTSHGMSSRRRSQYHDRSGFGNGDPPRGRGLNVNVHFHSLALDDVYTRATPTARPRFHRRSPLAWMSRPSTCPPPDSQPAPDALAGPDGAALSSLGGVTRTPSMNVTSSATSGKSSGTSSLGNVCSAISSVFQMTTAAFGTFGARRSPSASVQATMLSSSRTAPISGR